MIFSMIFIRGHFPFYTAIRHQPEQGYKRIKSDSDPWMNKGHKNSDEVEKCRNIAFKILADSGGEIGIMIFTDKRMNQKPIGNGAHKQDEAIEQDRRGFKMVFAHPARNEGQQRKPENQVKICPENGTVHMTYGVKQVMMIVPVDADIGETENIAEKHGQQIDQCAKRGVMGYFHFQHHDGEDNGDDGVAEGLDSVFCHVFLL